MLLLAKSCKKYLDLLAKSCNFAAETMEKSCRLPPIVYGIIDIGKVFGNATFLRCFFKNNANPFQNRNIRSQVLKKGYTSELLRSLNTERLLLKITSSILLNFRSILTIRGLLIAYSFSSLVLILMEMQKTTQELMMSHQ